MTINRVFVIRQGLRLLTLAVCWAVPLEVSRPARCARFFQGTAAGIASAAAGKGQPLLDGLGHGGYHAAGTRCPGGAASQADLHRSARPDHGHRPGPGRAWGNRRGAGCMVSCDLISSPHAIQQRLQKRVRTLVPELDAGKLFVNATHTHTAPGLLDGKFKGLYDVSKDPGVMKASEYAELFLDRVSGRSRRLAATQARERELGRESGGGRVQPPGPLCQRLDGDVRRHDKARVPMRRGGRGPLRRCPLLLGAGPEAHGPGSQRGLPRAGDRATL